MTVLSPSGLPISNQPTYHIMITSKHSEQNGSATRNQGAQASIALSIQKMALTFLLVIANLIHGGQQWYNFQPHCIPLSITLTLISSRVKNLLLSLAHRTIHYSGTYQTTNLVSSALCLNVVFKKKIPIHCLHLLSTSISHLNLFNYFILSLQHLSQLALLTPGAPIVPQASALPVLLPVYAGITGMLIPGDHVPGPDLLLSEFCLTHYLTDSVHNKLEENGYSGSHTFQYAQWEELREAGLKVGEIVQLKHAIMMWSTLWEV